MSEEVPWDLIHLLQRFYYDRGELLVSTLSTGYQ
jgi:hypothetical protein